MGNVKGESSIKRIVIIGLVLSCLTLNIVGITISSIVLFHLSQKSYLLVNNMTIAYIVVVIFNFMIIFIASFNIIMFHSLSFDDSGPNLIYIVPIVLVYGSCAAYHVFLFIKLKNFMNEYMSNPNNKMYITPNVTVQCTNSGSTSTAFTVGGIGSPFNNKAQVVVVQNTAINNATASENPNPNPNLNIPQTDGKANLSESQLQMQHVYTTPQYQPPMPGYEVPQSQPPPMPGYGAPQYQPPMPGYGAPQCQPPMPGYGAPQFQPPMQQGYYVPQFQPNAQGQLPEPNE